MIHIFHILILSPLLMYIGYNKINIDNTNTNNNSSIILLLVILVMTSIYHITRYLDKDNIDNILLERVNKKEYTNTQYTLIKRDKWCIEKGSELVAMTDVNIEYPWQSSQWFTSQGDIINICVIPVWC